MKAYKTYITITDPHQVVLTNLPFRSGQRVEVVILGDDDAEAESVQQLTSLLKDTQQHPQVQQLSDEDIAAEIAAYRSGA